MDTIADAGVVWLLINAQFINILVIIVYGTKMCLSTCSGLILPPSWPKNELM